MTFEIEIKLRLPPDVSKIRRTLRKLGFRVAVPRSLETNVLFDNPKDPLGIQGKLLRIRRVGRDSLLTYKGPSKSVRYKKRHELEVHLSDAEVTEEIFKKIGYQPVFRYEKFAPSLSSPPSEPARCCWMKHPSGISWSWKAPLNGSAALPAGLGFLRPITSPAATVTYTCSIAASIEFIPRICFSNW